VLTDLLGYYKRNVRKMNEFQIKKELKQIKLIEQELERNLKVRGVV
jgi:hypothetical protein